MTYRITNILKEQIAVISVLLGLAIISIFIYFLLFSIKDNNHVVAVVAWDKSSEYIESIRGFKDGLVNSGVISKDKLIVIERNAKSDENNLKKILSNLLIRPVDLIYSLSTPVSIEAKEMTTTTPIVFSMVSYPETTGLIDTMNYSGNNLVGVSDYIPAYRHYYSFLKLFGEHKNIGFVRSVDETNSSIQYSDFLKLLSGRGGNLINIAAHNFFHLKELLEKNKEDLDAIFLSCDSINLIGGEKIVTSFAKKNNIPTFSCNKSGVEQGALLGNVVNYYDLGKIAGIKAALILKGAKPTWLRTESADDDFLILNVRTAREIGIKIDDRILSQIDTIIGGRSEN